MYASAAGSVAVLKLLLAAITTNETTSDLSGWPAHCLYWAAWNGHVDTCSLLLARFPSVINCIASARFNAFNEHLQTALHAAASEGRIKVVKLLVQNGADVSVKDKVCVCHVCTLRSAVLKFYCVS